VGQRARVDDLEVTAGEPAEQVQRGIVPAWILGTGDVPRRAIVGEDLP